MTVTSVLEAGFSSPVFGAQTTFRAVMDALAQPGRPHTLPPLRVPAPLPHGLAAIALTLVDADTPLWCDPVLATQPGLADWIDFHLAAPRASDPAHAAFALCSDSSQLPDLGDFAIGTDEYPDRSTTIILHLPALTGGPMLTLNGPGISGTITLAPHGLPARFTAQWAENRVLYPRGVDLLLVCGADVVGLPRTTRIAEGA